MIKNILLALLVVILLGAVVVGFYDSARGASNFSLPTWNSGQSQGQGGGQGNGQGRGHQGQGNGQGQGQGGGQGQGQGGGNGQGQGTPVQHTWITLKGTVTAFDGQQTLTVDTAERGQLDLWLGRVGYASQQGVTFNSGESVTILGFDGTNGQFQAGEITNDTTGQTLYLRDPNGRPLWAGQGNGQGQGQGGGNGQGQGQGQGSGN
jgi:hypothetical protein